MATAPSASYPGNALLCHCVGARQRRRGGGGGGGGSGEMPPPRTFASPSRREIGRNGRVNPPPRLYEPLSPRLPFGDESTWLDLAQTISSSPSVLSHPAMMMNKGRVSPLDPLRSRSRTPMIYLSFMRIAEMQIRIWYFYIGWRTCATLEYKHWLRVLFAMCDWKFFRSGETNLARRDQELISKRSSI